MKSFMDAGGRCWEVAITIGAIKRVKGLLDVDLLAISEGDPPLMTRLSTDLVLVCDVLYALCKPAADAAGIDDEAFGSAMDGASMAKAMSALFDELIDFFRQSSRQEIATSLRLHQEIVADQIAMTEQAILQIKRPTVDCGR